MPRDGPAPFRVCEYEGVSRPLFLPVAMPVTAQFSPRAGLREHVSGGCCMPGCDAVLHVHAPPAPFFFFQSRLLGCALSLRTIIKTHLGRARLSSIALTPVPTSPLVWDHTKPKLPMCYITFMLVLLGGISEMAVHPEMCAPTALQRDASEPAVRPAAVSRCALHVSAVAAGCSCPTKAGVFRER